MYTFYLEKEPKNHVLLGRTREYRGSNALKDALAFSLAFIAADQWDIFFASEYRKIINIKIIDKISQ